VIALARHSRADLIISGDRDLTGLADPRPPVLTPREFLSWLESRG
jgi:predicted nucleic acid-binding protein